MSTTVADSPYSGTIHLDEPLSDGSVDVNRCTELFLVPFRYTSQIAISVKASSGAQILLYDESPDEKWAVKITLGSDKTSHSTIGLNTKDPVQEAAYPTREFHTPTILNANHLKSFIIQWRYGVIKVFDDGGDSNSPLLSWKGPSDMRIGHFGVRTIGSLGAWRVQGGPKFTTVQTNDIGAPYQHYKVNSGRLRFEVRAKSHLYVVLSKNTTDNVGGDLMHLLLAAWIGNDRSAIYKALKNVAQFDQADILSNEEFRGFWTEWNAYTIRFGLAGSSVAKMVYTSTTPLPEINYFGFIACYGEPAYVRALQEEP